jgi:hypothetical protein
MSDYLEGFVALLPLEAGGRMSAVEPRQGSYRPFARLTDLGPLLRVRLIDGPPRIGPGEQAMVVAELESGKPEEELLAPGAELDLLDIDGQVVGILNVLRLWRAAFAV